MWKREKGRGRRIYEKKEEVKERGLGVTVGIKEGAGAN